MSRQELGFGQKENPSTWISISHGKLAVRAEPDAEGATRRTYIAKDTVEEKAIWEYLYPNFTGDITGADFEETKFGLVYNVNLSAGDKDYVLRMQAPGRVFEQFAKRIPSINKDSSLYIGAFLNEKGGNVLYLKQDGKKVPMSFTRENLGDCPPPVESSKMGKVVWDFSAQEEFLYKLANNWFAKPAAIAEDESPF